MQFLRGDTHLTAKPELAAVGKAGRNVYVDGGAVHGGGEAAGGVGIGRHDALAVPGGMARDMRDGILQESTTRTARM